MKASQKAIDLIKSWEGCRLETYKCSANVDTIGFGHTLNVKPGMKITLKQAEQFLKQDLIQFEQAITKLVTVPLNQNQVDSLICFIFNIGINAFANSTLLRLLNQSKYQEASQQFERWVKAGGRVSAGLIRRREAERKLFLS